MDDVIINKSAIIEKCIHRIKEEYIGFEDEFVENYTKQDSIVLNIERATQACIDLGAYWVKKRKLGIPQANREVFQFLEKAKLIPLTLSEKLQAMVGFRDIAVHNFQKINLNIIRSIIEKDLDDLIRFKEIIHSTLI
ncbi:DUF86 domain-containing protein [bacterium]|nr:DUF86 domain-containing protein [bacterium]